MLFLQEVPLENKIYLHFTFQRRKTPPYEDSFLGLVAQKIEGFISSYREAVGSLLRAPSDPGQPSVFYRLHLLCYPSLVFCWTVSTGSSVLFGFVVVVLLCIILSPRDHILPLSVFFAQWKECLCFLLFPTIRQDSLLPEKNWWTLKRT